LTIKNKDDDLGGDVLPGYFCDRKSKNVMLNDILDEVIYVLNSNVTFK